MGDLSDLHLPDGMTRPYRPCPADFRERYIEMGQGKELEEHYHTNWRIIVRWIAESGGDELRALRHKASGGFARPNKRAGAKAKRYVIGRTLTAVRRGDEKG